MLVYKDAYIAHAGVVHTVTLNIVMYNLLTENCIFK